MKENYLFCPHPGSHGQLKGNKKTSISEHSYRYALLDQNATERAKISKPINEKLLSILIQECCFWNLAESLGEKLVQLKTKTQIRKL